jgi:hypothetical protein
VAMLCAAACFGAQEPLPRTVQDSGATAVPSGTVTGRVIAQDTQQPARFAMVMLQNVAGTSRSEGDGSFFGSSSSYIRTDAEGSFTAANIIPGDYYVTASAPGYVPERALLQAAVTAGADPVALLAAIPVVHVAAGETSTISVTIERGATISGKMQWEDGSPAAGISLNALPGASSTAVGQGLPAVLQGLGGGGANFSMTDDRGAFRITGLPAGTYVLRSQIQVPQQSGGVGRAPLFGAPIRLYSPGVFRRADAKPVTVKAGEERSDVRMVIDLRDLRTVSGHASSASAGLSVASGRVTLTDSSDTDQQPGGAIAANGDFTVRYVPAGSYTLKISGASTQAGSNRGRGNSDGQGASFQPFSQPLVVTSTDVSGVGVTLTPVASQP